MNLTLSNTSLSISTPTIPKLNVAYYDSEHDPRYNEGSKELSNKKNQDVVTVVLLHGYCGSSAYFSQLVDQLAPSYRLLIPDLVGHGASEALTQSTYHLSGIAKLIGSWLQAVGVQEAYVLGHSLGGYITLELARQMPELLSGFGLLHSTALPDSEQAQLNREKAIQTVQEQGIAAFVDGLVPKLLASDHPSYEKFLAAGAAIGYETKPEAVIGFARGMKERNDLTALIAGNKPVLLISGAKDEVIATDATFTGRDDATSCHVIEQAAHMGMMETPDEMATIIKQFIG